MEEGREAAVPDPMGGVPSMREVQSTTGQEAALAAPTAPTARYRNLEGLGKWVVWLTAGALLGSIAAFAIYIDYSNQFRLVDEMTFEELTRPGSLDKAIAAENRMNVIDLVLAVFHISSFVLMIIWFRAAYRNLRHFGARQRFRQGWAVWGWLIPVVAYWWPKMLANDIHTALASWNPKTAVTRGLLAWWWGLWIVSGTLVWASTRSYFSAETIDEYVASAIVGAAGAAVTVFSSITIILLVRRVSREMSERKQFVDRQAMVEQSDDHD